MANSDKPHPSSNGSPSERRRGGEGSIPLEQDFNPFDARNYDSGGFGFGGSSGSAGGFGVGGNGPQTGAYGSQANYGQGAEAGGPDSWLDDQRDTEHWEVHHDWRDALPHNFRGWGPMAPDYSAPPVPPRRVRVVRRPPPHPADTHYMAWREQQMRKLDEEYLAWRSERQARFNEDFEDWRRKRAAGSGHDAESLKAASAPSSQGEAKTDKH
ncbi:MAG: hypothetical protein GC155_01000 [Alphaproteobacteria bacterium]|nr:hypothetical protein [Alphaproteobacteria bacterium]